MFMIFIDHFISLNHDLWCKLIQKLLMLMSQDVWQTCAHPVASDRGCVQTSRWKHRCKTSLEWCKIRVSHKWYHVSNPYFFSIWLLIWLRLFFTSTNLLTLAPRRKDWPTHWCIIYIKTEWDEPFPVSSALCSFIDWTLPLCVL